MIKANQLRIGNLIKFNNHIEKERIVTVDLRFFASWAGGRSREEWKPDEELNNYYSAIPLTSEILESFGFGKQILVTRVMWHLFPIQIRESAGDFYLNKYKYNVQIKYLHQLQNLYFALTGEELQIKL